MVHTGPTLSHYCPVKRVLADGGEVVKKLARGGFTNGGGEGEGANACTPCTPSYLGDGPKQVDWAIIK